MLSGYSQYQKLTLDSSKIDSDLSHFPLPIPLGTAVGLTDADVTDIFDEVGSDYLKIAVTMADGDTQLYVEVEQWDAANEKALLWVSRDTWTIASASDTEIYLYFDSTAADNTGYVGTPGSRSEVWNSDFAAVYTMAQDPAGGTDSIIDSTSNANHGTPNGGMGSSNLVDADIGKAIQFDGADDYISIDLTGVNQGFSVAAKVYADASSQANWSPFVLAKSNESWYSWALRVDNSNRYQLAVSYDGNNWIGATDGSNISSGVWVCLTGTYESADSGLTLYKDGASIDTNTLPGSRNSHDIGTVFGLYSDTTSYWYGKIAEIRICSGVVLTGAWIKADYHAQTDNLLTFGATQSAGPATISCGSGSFSITGSSASFANIIGSVSALVGSFSLLGQAVELLFDRRVSAEAYSVTLTGTATLEYNRLFSVAAGSVSLSGKAVAFKYRKVLDAATGSVSISELLTPSLLSQWLENVTARNYLSQTLRTDAFIQDQLTAFDMGPVELGDTSQGLYAKVWKLEVSNRDVYLYKASGADWELEQYLFSTDSFPTSSFDLTFDQTGKVFVCWEETGSVWIYYYDPTLPGMTTREVCSGRTPRARLDIRAKQLTSDSDIMLFYLNDSADCLEYRIQSDRYDTAYQLTSFTAANRYLELLVLGSNNRLYLWYSEYDATTNSWSLGSWHSAPYPALFDEAAALAGDSVLMSETRYRHPIVESSTLTGDNILYASLANIILEAAIDSEASRLAGDTVLSAATEYIAPDTFIQASMEDTETALAGDSILEASWRLVMLETTLSDEEIALAGDTILSATKS